MIKKYFLFIICLLLIPNIVLAVNLDCNNSGYNYEETFTCKLEGKAQEDYTTVSGTIVGEHVKCSLYETSLTSNSSNSKTFDLSGVSSDGQIALFKCQVTDKLTEDTDVVLKISDFAYATSQSSELSSEILRSNSVRLNKYDENAKTTKDSKPRDTTNGNSLLNDVVIQDVDFNFSKFSTIYNIEVLYEVSELNFTFKKANENANIRIDGNTKLTVNKTNTVDVYVTSPDNSSVTCYTFNVKRLARGQEIYYANKDSSLFSLTIPGKQINFETVIYDYYVNIDRDTTELEVDATPTVAEADVTVTGANDLKNGSIITITVTSSDSTQSTKYYIHVTKQAAKKTYTKQIILAGFVVVIVLLMFLFIKSSARKNGDVVDQLSIKENRKLKKGKKFDPNSVENVTPDAVKTENATDLNGLNELEKTDQNVSIIKESNATAEVMEAMDYVERNNTSSVNASVDLSKTQVIAIPVDQANNNQNNSNQ